MANMPSWEWEPALAREVSCTGTTQEHHTGTHLHSLSKKGDLWGNREVVSETRGQDSAQALWEQMQPLGSQEGLGITLRYLILLPSQLTSVFSATLCRQWEMPASRALPILVTSASPVSRTAHGTRSSLSSGS